MIDGKPHICLPGAPNNYMDFTIEHRSTKLFYDDNETEPAHAVQDVSIGSAPQYITVAAVLYRVVRNGLLTELTTKYQSFLQEISTSIGSIVDYTNLSLEEEKPGGRTGPPVIDQSFILLFKIPVPPSLKTKINETVYEYRALAKSMNWKPRPISVSLHADFVPRKLCFAEDDTPPYINAYV